MAAIGIFISIISFVTTSGQLLTTNFFSNALVGVTLPNNSISATFSGMRLVTCASIAASLEVHFSTIATGFRAVNCRLATTSFTSQSAVENTASPDYKIYFNQAALLAERTTAGPTTELTSTSESTATFPTTESTTGVTSTATSTASTPTDTTTTSSEITTFPSTESSTVAITDSSTPTDAFTIITTPTSSEITTFTSTESATVVNTDTTSSTDTIISSSILSLTTTTGNSCPGATNACSPDGSYHIHPTNCSYYLRCNFGAYVEMACASGTVFDSTITNCNYPASVTVPCKCGP